MTVKSCGLDDTAGEWIQAKQTKKKAPTARRRVDVKDTVVEVSDDAPYRPPNRHKPDKVINDDPPPITEPERVSQTLAETERVIEIEKVTETQTVEAIAEIEKVTDTSEKINDWSELSDRLKSGQFKPIIKETVPLPTVGYVVDRRMSYSDAIIDLNQMIPVFVSKDPRWWFRPPKPPTPDLFDDYFNSWQFRNNVNLSCEQRIEKYSDDEYDADIEYDQDPMFDDAEIIDIEVSTKVVDT